MMFTGNFIEPSYVRTTYTLKSSFASMFANVASFNMNNLDGWDLSRVTSMQSRFTNRPSVRIIMEGSVLR